MARYLLYDDSCVRCGSIAYVVEACSDGWVVSKSLRDPAMRELLRRWRSEWKWRPMLLESDGTRVRVYTGLRMAVHLCAGLGPIRAFLILTSAG